MAEESAEIKLLKAQNKVMTDLLSDYDMVFHYLESQGRKIATAIGEHKIQDNNTPMKDLVIGFKKDDYDKITRLIADIGDKSRWRYIEYLNDYLQKVETNKNFLKLLK